MSRRKQNPLPERYQGALAAWQINAFPRRLKARAKAVAEEQGITLRDLLVRALIRECDGERSR